ncbi:MAG: hypothetical protein IPN69_09115 [Acidobacteria bacterium]|nr:hypothetical protein [Acidobacteriota bacterium]
MSIGEVCGNYSRLLHKTRHLSMSAAFLISLAASIDIVRFIHLMTMEASVEWLRANRAAIFVMVGFHLAIATIFAARFVVFAKGASWIIKQLWWAAGCFSILAYKLATAKMLWGSFFGHRPTPALDAMYYETFLGASTGLFVLLTGYLVLSPIKELLWLVLLVRRTKTTDRENAAE